MSALISCSAFCVSAGKPAMYSSMEPAVDLVGILCTSRLLCPPRRPRALSMHARQPPLEFSRVGMDRLDAADRRLGVNAAVAGTGRRDEPIEDSQCIQWARAALGVVLHRLDRERAMAQPLHRAVVEVDLADDE